MLSVGAVLLTGSKGAAGSRVTATTGAVAEVRRLGDVGVKLYGGAKYFEAREAFRSVAVLAEKRGLRREAAWYWNNTGACSLVLRQYRAAVADFQKSKALAEASGEMGPAFGAANNLASTYLQIGQPTNSIQIALQSLARPEINAYPPTRAALRCQLADALAKQNRFDDSEQAYHEGINDFVDQGKFQLAMIALATLGLHSLDANRPGLAEWALGESLRIARLHNIGDVAAILEQLARLRARQGDSAAATALFAAALAAPPGVNPRWGIYLERGRFRTSQGDFAGALADFREGRRVANAMRADIIPADQDRVALESNGLNLVYEGFVEAGNRIARRSGDGNLLRETFDVAEQDRLWSLRALVPSPNDWRSRLPPHYWTLLSRYQALQRTALGQSGTSAAGSSPALDADAVGKQLQQIEVQAADTTPEAQAGASAESPLDHIQKVLAPDSVLFSFHVTATSSWLWAVDRQHVATWPLPDLGHLKAEIAEFRKQITAGNPSDDLASTLYGELFGQVPASLLAKEHWLLELDGPLYELPFAALVADREKGRAIHLVERAAIQTIPSALLLQGRTVPLDGGILAVGDPVYNPADKRYQGPSRAAGLVLPRLPGTADEVQACTSNWGAGKSRLLTGTAATLDGVRDAMRNKPAIVHFATHVVSAPGDFRSGMLALSLDSSGGIGLLGPKEIVARPVSASLIVLDGCHSAQGDSLPSAGLMGLTRAWIGAGAGGVLATQWDIADEGAKNFMLDFYAALRAAPGKGSAFALQKAQLLAIRRGASPSNARAGGPVAWAGYFLISK